MLLFPREHGAWGMLATPFVVALILARGWDWLLIPGAVAVFFGFIVREPLVVIARQTWVWKSKRPETDLAWRSLGISAAVLAVCAYFLLGSLPAAPLLALAAMGGILTILAVWMTVKNRQRSIWLQVLSSTALSSTAVIAALCSTRTIPTWAWWVWGSLALHSLGGIFVVHTRLEAKIAARTGVEGGLVNVAFAIQAAQVVLAIFLLWRGQGMLAIPFAVSAVLNTVELWRLRKPAALSEPLKRVGFRMLGASIAQALCVVLGLW